MRAFFEKNGKILLAIMSVGLMLIWMRPSGGGPTDRSDIEIGRLAGKKVTNGELGWPHAEIALLQGIDQLALMRMDERELGGLNQMMQSYPAPLLLLQFQQSGLPPQISFIVFLHGLNAHNQDLHFFLLATEAAQQNLTATNDEVMEMIHNMGMTQEEFDGIFKSTGASRVTLQKAVTDFIAISKLNEMAYAGLRASLPEMRYVAAQARLKVSVAYAMLDAKTPLPGLAAPTAAEIAAQFAAYKDIVANTGQMPPEVLGHHYPFGYKYGDRVKVEWLVFNHLAVRDLVAATETPEQQRADQLEAYNYYKEHMDEFMSTPATPTTGPATNPATAPAPTTRPFNDPEVASKLINKQLDKHADDLVNQMAEEAPKEAGEPWKGGQDDKGFREKIDPNDWAKYDKIADSLAAQGRFKKYRPEVQGPSGWADLPTLTALKGIGQSYYTVQRGNQQMTYPFAMLALAVREMGHENKDPETRLLQVGVEQSHVLTDRDGNMYVYRVVAAEPSHAPAAADEVREQVVNDIQKRKTYESFVARAKKFADDAATKGLDAIPDLTVVRLEPFSRMVERMTGFGPVMQPVELPKLGTLPVFTDAAFGLADAEARRGATGRPAASAPATAATTGAAGAAGATAPAKRETTSFGVDERLCAFAMELLRSDPMNEATFDEPGTRREMSQMAQIQSILVFTPKWSTLDSVAKRVGYVPVQPFAEN